MLDEGIHFTRGEKKLATKHEHSGGIVPRLDGDQDSEFIQEPLPLKAAQAFYKKLSP